MEIKISNKIQMALASAAALAIILGGLACAGPDATPMPTPAVPPPRTR